MVSFFGGASPPNKDLGANPLNSLTQSLAGEAQYSNRQNLPCCNRVQHTRHHTSPSFAHPVCLRRRRSREYY